MVPFEKIFEALDKSGARYVVVGGVAVVLHGYARMTADLDLVVDWNAQSAANVVAQLSALGLKARAPVDPAGLADPKMRKAWLEEKGMMVFTFVDPTNPLFVVDLFLEPPLPFEELWSRSRCTEIGSSKVRIAGIADLIALKTRSGRPQDLADIEALEELRKNADHG